MRGEKIGVSGEVVGPVGVANIPECRVGKCTGFANEVGCDRQKGSVLVAWLGMVLSLLYVVGRPHQVVQVVMASLYKGMDP